MDPPAATRIRIKQTQLAQAKISLQSQTKSNIDSLGVLHFTTRASDMSFCVQNAFYVGINAKF